MSQDPRHVPHKLHAALHMATALLDLPLTAAHLEVLALELTGPVRALIAEAVAGTSDDSPVQYAIADPSITGDGEFEVTEYAGCVTRIGLDVDLDSPAGTVKDKVQRQPDTTGIEIRDAHTIAVTVEPGSLDAWRWWLHQFGIDPATVKVDGTAMTATGHKDGADVHLRGDGVTALYADRDAAELMCLIAPATSRSRP
ncbi:hypothetical protein [Streptomyces sp. GbtcB6]|uniref:hypothetical protein n=1 Tax=Streptomyces sp. GbtcB6 TaxID=2824751 RepID=UPI001C2F33E5|nr:hypothetical protein [Streptomyces sp. GbtcB6]